MKGIPGALAVELNIHVNEMRVTARRFVADRVEELNKTIDAQVEAELEKLDLALLVREALGRAVREEVQAAIELRARERVEEALPRLLAEFDI